MLAAVRSIAGLALGALLAAGASAGAESPQPALPNDPVVQEVVRMLDAGVGEDVVVRWLEREQRSPGRLTPEDLIALTRAQASPALVERLLAATPAAEPPPGVPPPGAATRPAEGIPRLELSLRYRPYRAPEAADEDAWRLFAYIDGRVVAWSDGHNWLAKARRTVETEVELSPGPHVLRLIEERHVRYGKRWRHEARVCPDPIAFEGDARRRLELELLEPAGLDFRGLKGFRLAFSDASGTSDWSPLAGPFTSWPPLCEELEANPDRKGRLARADRRALEHCVRWAGLWPGVAAPPERAEVRAELERANFRP